jgi:hypothetical protein
MVNSTIQIVQEPNINPEMNQTEVETTYQEMDKKVTHDEET